MRKDEGGRMKAEGRMGQEPFVVHPSSFILHPSSFRIRPGVTILEVMFAILIALIGLLGAVAILPVASSQARRGRVNDAIAAAGRASISRLDAMGLRRPDKWFAYQSVFNDLHGVTYSLPLGTPRSPWRDFEAYRLITANPPPWQQTAFVASGARNWLGGVDSFCIDPRFVAANNISGTLNIAPEATRFPALTTTALIGAGLNPPTPFMWRLNLYSGVTVGVVPQAMPKVMADNFFVIKDDPVFNRDNSDRSKPATLPFDSFATGTLNAARQNEGHLSWMATLVPERNATPQWTGTLGAPGLLPLNDLYTLSLVMFYDRPADMALFLPGGAPNPTSALSERLVQVTSINGVYNNSSGPSVAYGGGEFELIYTENPAITVNGQMVTAEQMLKIRPNDWICLAGQTVHQARTTFTNEPIRIPIFKWYRVADCEPEVALVPGGGPNDYHRYVTLIGQDWPLPAVDVSAGPANQLRTWAIIVEGVVGVYEKSIRLETGPSD